MGAMTADTIARLRAIHEAATPEPWHTYEYDSRIGHHTGVRHASGEDLSTSRDIETATAIVTEHNTHAALLDVVEAARQLDQTDDAAWPIVSRKSLDRLATALAKLDEVAPHG